MGLWRTCVTTRGSNSKEIAVCGSHVGLYTTGWFQAIQTLEIVSLIFFVVGFVMTSALLLWSSNARLARANPWILLIAGIFMEVGVIIFVVKLGMNNLGYSLYLTWIASNCVIVASIIIYCAEQRNRRPTEFTSGPTTSTPVFYPPPSNTNPVHISQPTYTPQPVAPVQPQPVQRSKPPYPGAFQVYPQQQVPPPYPQAMTYQPPATEHKFTDFQ
ncbi:uncharacterized protein LOC128226771 [Mya arenaria]|uniref:uncharacterized protein LOC128226771 n=1 Tax=Mya arenaria TaxID=6604 RepID=UPI0022DF5A19|nr:uncharacterized protein LOC128226771 [Mya arenaria]